MKYFSLKNKILIVLCLFTMFNSLSVAYAAEEAFTLYGAATLAPVRNTNPNIYVQAASDTTTSVKMYSDSSEDSREMKSYPNQYALTVLGSEYGWIYVADDNDNRGYIKSTDLVFKNGTKPDNSLLVPSKAQQIVDFSLQFIGTPYVWGGTNLKTGVDCSGLIYKCYQNFGIDISRTSKQMYANDGYTISKSELRPGDLIFFNTLGNGISHVGMYIGDNKYINAEDRGVRIADINSSYSLRTFVACKRVITE